MPALPENKFGLTGELNDFSQEQYEIYQPKVVKATHDNYFDFGGGASLSAEAVVRGATVRAAIASKILTGIELDEVGKMKPPAVRWLAEQILKHIRAVVNPPPDPS